MGLNRILSKRPAATCILWVDESKVYLQLAAELNSTSGTSVLSEAWNPAGESLHSAAARDLLTAAIGRLFRQAGRFEYSVRLVLGDGLCVTRVTTGESRHVQHELRDIEHRSQLYLSLGLGDKLTGHLQIAESGDQTYAVTAIVNRHTLQTIYEATKAAALKLESIEPASLSLTRQIGALGLDAAQPVLKVSFDRRRCDVTITRAGRLMLSYRVSGWQKIPEAAELVASHLARLKRFCERYRLIGKAELRSVVLLGAAEDVAVFRRRLAQQDSDLLIHDASDLLRVDASLGANAGESESATIRLALMGAMKQPSLQAAEMPGEVLPTPDLLQQIEALQPCSTLSRIHRGLWPAYAAASLMIALAAFHLYQASRMSSLRNRLDRLTSEVTQGDAQLKAWERKTEWVRRIQAVDRTVGRIDWTRLMTACAECLPGNARLNRFQLSEADQITLRGGMVGHDFTSVIVSSLKAIPMIQNVSIESVSSTAGLSNPEYQFDIRCQIRSDFLYGASPAEAPTPPGRLVRTASDKGAGPTRCTEP